MWNYFVGLPLFIVMVPPEAKLSPQNKKIIMILASIKTILQHVHRKIWKYIRVARTATD